MNKLEKMESAGKKIVSTLIDHGYEAYFVGGYVRDKLANRPIMDIDIATSAKPEEVMRIFKKHVPTGLQHGTVTVLSEQIPFEVTTFRTESKYESFRRPAEVTFVNDLYEDLKRRDFTINAIAMDLEGKLHDPFHGSDDLREKKLRCVGKAVERFNEDALRMMRCVRFAAEYQLQIDEQTWFALLEQKSNLKHIAMERIRMELEKMIEGSDPVRAVELLHKSGLLHHVKHDLCLPLHRLKEAVQNNKHRCLNTVSGVIERWFMFYKLFRLSPELCQQSMQHLTFSKAKIQQIMAVLRFDQALLVEESKATSEPRLYWVKNVLEYGAYAANVWLNMCRTLGYSGTIFCTQGSNWLEQMQVHALSDLKIKGNDLIQLQNDAGPWIGQLLHQILLATALGIIPNKLEEQMSYAKKVINNDQK